MKYSILPGANALVPSIVAAGFDTSEFVHRMGKLIEELHEFNFDGKIAIAREVSKLFEEYQTFEFSELWDLYQTGKLVLKGEFVV